MRRRIVALGVGMTALVILAFSIPLALLIVQNVESKRLDEARLQAENVAYFISTQDPDGDQVGSYLSSLGGRTEGVTWVRFSDGKVVGKPPSGIDESRPDPDPDNDDDLDLGEVSAATVQHTAGGALTRVQAITRGGPTTVFTFLTDDELHDGIGLPLLVLGVVSAGLLLLSLLGAETLSRRLTGSLEKTADAAERLAAGDTDARAPETGPREVAQVGASLNGLAARIDEVIAVERESVADLSHRLRTPLTALRLDVDALEDEDTAERLGHHVDTLERTLTAIIHAARRPQREGRVPHCDAIEVVGERAAFWTPLAEDQDRRVRVRLPDGVALVRASADDLAAAVDALIENVIAHTPEGSGLDVDVALQEHGAAVVVAVSDEGPGIPPDAGVRGRSDRGSSGLGLDIARRCADSSGGSLHIRAREPRGATVELRLGSP